jgi:sugar/nucleoside kinase (ribokinase family)
MKRKGICCGGNWIVDEVKLIEAWPEQDSLVSILHEETGTGGAAYNVLMDLRRMDSRIPLEAVGVLGTDPNGDKIAADIRKNRIKPVGIVRTDKRPTSRTDVMTVASTARRTFFHNRGTNALLDTKHFDFSAIRAEYLHIGYALLLDRLDGPDKRFGTRMARLLASAKKSGLKTSLDVVTDHDAARFRAIVLPSLRFTDVLVLNEIEASRVTGIDLKDTLDPEDYSSAARELFRAGVSRLTVIHRPECSFAFTPDGSTYVQPSHSLPDGFVKGTVGAGDAFCSAILYSLYAGLDIASGLKLASSTAALSLSSPSSTEGVPALANILSFSRRTPYRNISPIR